MPECEDILDEEDQCSFAKQFCEAEGEIDIYKLYYCDIKNDVGGLILYFLILFLMFYLLALVAEEYLTPALTSISDKLKCSESLAGVTLLALGNGANDVITAIVAYKGADMGYTCGFLVGIGMLVCNGLAGVCVLISPVETIVPQRLFIRDLIFY